MLVSPRAVFSVFHGIGAPLINPLGYSVWIEHREVPEYCLLQVLLFLHYFSVYLLYQSVLV